MKNSSQFLANIIDSSDGQFVSVTFVKQNGDVRKLNGRLGVVKYLKNPQHKSESTKYINIYDVQNGGYRNIDRNNILEICASKITASIVK